MGGALKSMFWGGISGAVTFGIGSAFTSTAGTVLTLTDKVARSAMAQGLVHGFAQGTLSLMQGKLHTWIYKWCFWKLGASLFGALLVVLLIAQRHCSIRNDFRWCCI